MKYKIIYSNYSTESGISSTAIQTPRGIFVGTSFLLDEDKDIESSFFGCKNAEKKAYIKALKLEKTLNKVKIEGINNIIKNISNSKKFNKDSFEARKMRREIFLLKTKNKEIDNEIQTIKDSITREEKIRRRILHKDKVD